MAESDLIPRVLIVEDDERLATLTQDYLRKNGLEVAIETDGNRAIRRIITEQPDMVVLDVMLPSSDGLTVCREVRQQYHNPILMLTARTDDMDQVLGLEMGADDYVAKPCTPRELTARIRAILRRTGSGTAAAGDGAGMAGAAGAAGAMSGGRLTPEVLTAGALTLWPGSRRVQWHGEALALTSTQFNLLEALVRSPGTLVTKADLSERALGRKLGRFDRSIDVHISALRQKLAEQAPPQADSPITTVRGQGYQWTAE